jgi:hypothetical protein
VPASTAGLFQTMVQLPGRAEAHGGQPGPVVSLCPVPMWGPLGWRAELSMDRSQDEIASRGWTGALRGLLTGTSPGGGSQPGQDQRVWHEQSLVSLRPPYQMPHPQDQPHGTAEKTEAQADLVAVRTTLPPVSTEAQAPMVLTSRSHCVTWRRHTNSPRTPCPGRPGP